MFNREKFSEVLEQINSKYTSMTEFAKHAKFDRTYTSKGINLKLQNPPTPDILRKIADNSRGITTYVELLEICGYLTEEDLGEIREKPNNEILVKIKLESNISETKSQVKELVSLLERANELMNSLNKK